MKKKGNFLAGLIAGAVAGAAAALLLTPKKGQETREIITDRASDIRGRASGPISSLRDRARRVRNRAGGNESSEDESDGSANGSAQNE
jgi:gas vesicle protein